MHDTSALMTPRAQVELADTVAPMVALRTLRLNTRNVRRHIGGVSANGLKEAMQGGLSQLRHLFLGSEYWEVISFTICVCGLDASHSYRGNG